MNDLNPEDRALLDLAREGHEPTDEDRGRVRRALALRLGVGTGLAGATATTSKAATAFVFTKVLAAVAIAGAIGGAGAVAYHATTAAPPVVAATAARSSEQETAAPSSVPSRFDSHESSPDEAMQPSVDARPTGTVTVAPKRPSRMNEPAARGAAPIVPVNATAAGPVASPPSSVAATTVLDALGASVQEPSRAPEPTTRDIPAALPPPTTLEAETRLIRAGVAALHGGDAARALALFDEHARRFPDGALAEERAAERVIALASLHRCDLAHVAAAEFLRDHSHSPLAARVREPCIAVSNP